MAQGMRTLAESAALREQLARKGKELMRSQYSLDAFKRSLDEMYTYAEAAVKQDVRARKKR
jgi:hypothetical protein